MGQHILPLTNTAARRRLGARLLVAMLLLLSPGGLPPAMPPPGLVAVLAGGMLPCLERLLRRTGEAPEGPETEVWTARSHAKHDWHLWIPPAAHGESRQAVALVVVLGKLLHRINFIELAVALRLGPLLTCAACEWLPELPRITLLLTMRLPMTALRLAVLAWLLILVVRCGGGGGVAARTGPGTAGALGTAGSSYAGGSGGWRRLLLAEVRAMALLAATLRQAEQQQVDLQQCVSTAAACCAVAAACPDEVRRAAGPSMWQPELVRGPVPALRGGGDSTLADFKEALAELLEAWGGSGSSSGKGEQAFWRLLADMAGLEPWGHGFNRMAALLVPPAEARMLLRTCSYRACTCLAGGSEVEARLQACGRCGAAWCCCRGFQASHWLEGHKEACVRSGATGRAG
ncbi:hypothetical protein TSOC_011533 [Tetrabaena socialis]|uniref:MYND-type domain-containing protein n=1 Tax=Tetrabaena socialis TaxID=47790 RepID=A0A2J7ZQE6_9CHLO|nr:hypothetical protein TSOC_011533 [Tetrabaena socialis]|eukprot:PNH02489.1 hypothetical protein TSOC_011533 [Tetrabaena socialis]